MNPNEVKKKTMQELHDHMGEQIGTKQRRLHQVVETRSTDTLWALITAAVEETNIRFHGLKDVEAAKMRGRFEVILQTPKQETPKQKEGEGDYNKTKEGTKWKKATSLQTKATSS